MPTSQHREPPSSKPAHLTANTAKTVAKTLHSAPIQPHHPPNALLELAEMRGNEREIDLSLLSPRNYKWVRVRLLPIGQSRLQNKRCLRLHYIPFGDNYHTARYLKVPETSP